MKDDRAQVLAQIRESLKTAHLPSARAAVAPRAAASPGDPAALVKPFRDELEPLGASSSLAKNDAQAIEIVLDLVSKADGKDLLAWSDAELPVRELGAALGARGFTRREVNLPRDAAGRHARLLELEPCAAGITGALAGIADTGSLALLARATRPRLVSLLPPLHIALLPVSRLFPTMASFFAAEPELTRSSSNLVLITGPSRTADIELTLTRGVHGPKTLHVVLLEWL